MQPQIALDSAIVVRNFKAWHAFAGVPVRPVIKARGYGWGFEPLVMALDALCDCYCVGDIDELFEARRYSSHPMIVLTSIPANRMSAALDAGGIPTITSRDELEAVNRWVRQTGIKPKIRVGVLPAVGWSGLSLREIGELAPHLAASRLDIEVWSHVTDYANTAMLQGHIAQAVQTIRTHGGHVIGTDLASSFSLARSGALGTSARVGIGLFGSTGSNIVDGVRCALMLQAPVVKDQFFPAGTKIGYGERVLESDGNLLTVRCGYGDGLPKSLGTSSDIVSVGMQYTTMRPGGQSASGAVQLLGARSDLDAFAADSNAGVHEIVTALGNAKTSQNVLD